MQYYYVSIINPVNDLQGNVSDLNGVGIEGAIVLAQGVNATKLRYGLTDSFGNYRLQTEYAISSVKCSAITYELVEEFNAPAPVDQLDFVLGEIVCAYPDELNIEEFLNGATENELELFAFPNPANNKVNIELKTAKTEVFDVQIMNAVGQLVFAKKDVFGAFTWDSSSVLTGVYMVFILTENQEKAMTRVMIIK